MLTHRAIVYGRRYAHYLGVIVNVYNTKLRADANAATDSILHNGPYVVEFSAVIDGLAGHEEVVVLRCLSSFCVHFDFSLMCHTGRR